MEFIVLASFMLLVLLGFFAVTSSNVLQAKEESNRKISGDIAEFAYHEIEIAKSINDGYARVFVMPESVNGINYNITITDNRELSVNYLGYEYVRFLPSNVTGNISKGLNSIKKINGIVYMNNIPVQLPELLIELMMKGNGVNVISFLSDGSVVLKGALTTGTTPSQDPLADEFVVKANGINVAIINLDTGSMAIKGSLFQNQASLSPSAGSNFIVKNSSGSIITFIDDSGNFFLKKTLTQNGNP